MKRMTSLLATVLIMLISSEWSRASTAVAEKFSATTEFEQQEFIWLTWVEKGNLGGAPFANVALEVMKAITPHVKVKLVFSQLTADDASFFGPYRLSPTEAESRLREKLTREGIDLRRVELFFLEQPVGAIQDPGPFFLRSQGGQLALTDYAFDHPDPRIGIMDRQIAERLGLPTVVSSLVSEGGGRQVNGQGTMLLVESVERARNPGLSRDAIELEHKRVNGVSQIIWLKDGPADEGVGRLPDGKWGIGTGGHVDVFARFADANTILLAQVDMKERESTPLWRETHRRMEENARILAAARNRQGRPFRILRVPMPDTMTARIDYDALSREERSWFEGATPGESMEFYLPAGYLNFIIANRVVVTAKFWRPGMASSQRTKDRQAVAVLQRAFPGRKVVQVDVLPLLYDGGGLHCHSRNQPFAKHQRF